MSPIKDNRASRFFTQVEKSVSSALVEDVLEMPGGAEQPNTLESTLSHITVKTDVLPHIPHPGAKRESTECLSV
ncbi:hypothetical protein CgunFtcFv8_013759 [Champsocephalus gunnari]|uniref:Uncharacterized protein n=1 Tax=Champsocephalus gunnari TaxID=52237 RepID=A0AAN8E3W0_CHAGU|nr:hypothetical protein CgunFtcFv8_013759 [Champsocephalus gunnari]